MPLDREAPESAEIVRDSATPLTEAQEQTARELPPTGDAAKKDLRSTIKDAIKAHPDQRKIETVKVREHVRKVGSGKDETVSRETPAAKDVAPAKAAPMAGDKEIPAKDLGKPDAIAPEAASAAPPAALSKELKAQWDKLDPAVRNEFARLEAESAKGVEKLRSKYKPLDDAFAPFKADLQRYNRTESEAVTQLFSWHQALAGPQKAQAFAALAKAHNFDLSSLAPRPSGAAQQTQPNQNQQPDPRAILEPYLGPVTQEVQALRAEFNRRDAERVQSDIAAFATDKPHFEKVRVAMGVLMQSGQLPAGTPKEVFDEAYRRACRADPEIFEAMRQEETDKREADAKAAQEAAGKKAADEAAERKRKENEAIAKARKAGIGPRTSSPTGLVGAPKAGQSVRDSLKAAIKEVGATI